VLPILRFRSHVCPNTVCPKVPVDAVA
jgi:hypothetical protein